MKYLVDNTPMTAGQLLSIAEELDAEFDSLFYKTAGQAATILMAHGMKIQLLFDDPEADRLAALDAREDDMDDD